MRFFESVSRLALKLRYGDVDSGANPPAIRPPVEPQSASGFAQLPIEIKEIIFQELWNEAGTLRHIILQWGRVVGMRCVTDVTGPDEARQSCGELRYTPIEDKAMWRRLASPWAVHWKCEELYQSGSTWRSSEWTPFLSLLLTCRQLYFEARASIYANVTFCVHNLETLHSLIIFRPSLIHTIQHLQLTICLPLWTKRYAPGLGEKEVMARWRECCQVLEQAKSLSSVYLWFDRAPHGVRHVFYTVPEGEMNPYVFGEKLASVLTVDIPVNPDRPRAWEDVASMEPRFTIRARGWPKYDAQSDRGRPHLIVRAGNEPEPDGSLPVYGPAITFNCRRF